MPTGRSLASAAAAAMATDADTPRLLLQTLFVWDFDWTVVNCNSDEYIPAQFLGHAETQNGFRRLIQTAIDNNSNNDTDTADIDWHKCVEKMVARAMVEGGASVQDVLDAAARMPYLTEVREAIVHDIATFNNKNNNEVVGQMILSDGNTLFISAYLEANGMDRAFDEGIMTNIGSFTTKSDGENESSGDSKGSSNGASPTLRVVHQSAKYGGHSCARCARSPNLCKTQALNDKLTNQLEGRRPRQIVYIGDGANDICPALNVLGKDDVLLVREGVKRKEANDRSGPETDDEARDKVEVVGGSGSSSSIVVPLGHYQR